MRGKALLDGALVTFSLTYLVGLETFCKWVCSLSIKILSWISLAISESPYYHWSVIFLLSYKVWASLLSANKFPCWCRLLLLLICCSLSNIIFSTMNQRSKDLYTILWIVEMWKLRVKILLRQVRTWMSRSLKMSSFAGSFIVLWGWNMERYVQLYIRTLNDSSSYPTHLVAISWYRDLINFCVKISWFIFVRSYPVNLIMHLS